MNTKLQITFMLNFKTITDLCKGQFERTSVQQLNKYKLKVWWYSFKHYTICLNMQYAQYKDLVTKSSDTK